MAASRLADVVRATYYYVTDAGDADAVFAVCGETLGEIRPAATHAWSSLGSTSPR